MAEGHQRERDFLQRQKEQLEEKKSQIVGDLRTKEQIIADARQQRAEMKTKLQVRASQLFVPAIVCEQQKEMVPFSRNRTSIDRATTGCSTIEL